MIAKASALAPASLMAWAGAILIVLVLAAGIVFLFLMTLAPERLVGRRESR